MSKKITLEDLGWNSFFQTHKDSLDTADEAARVMREQKSLYEVLGCEGEATAKLAGKLRHEARDKSELPVVGDWVLISSSESDRTPVIRHILPRRTAVSRKSAGGRKRSSGGSTEIQMLAANVDTIFIINGLDDDFNVRRIERYLTLVYNSGADPVIILNKTDLCEDIPAATTLVEQVAFGVPVHACCGYHMDDLEPLKKRLTRGRTGALLGSSGVGKSTIINTLLGYEHQKVQTVSDKVKKGRHTTSQRELIFLPGGGILMDSPGLREIQLWGQSDDVDEIFTEIENLARNCRFNDCRHEKEPDCAVNAAVDQGDLQPQRLENYKKMKRELKYLEERKNKPANVIEKEKWFAMMKKK